MHPDVPSLVEAAETLLANLIDASEHRPDLDIPGAEFPRDENGDPWYPDVWALRQALEPFQRPEEEQAR